MLLKKNSRCENPNLRIFSLDSVSDRFTHQPLEKMTDPRWIFDEATLQQAAALIAELGKRPRAVFGISFFHSLSLVIFIYFLISSTCMM